MKVIRKIIEIDEELCDGCGQCVPACAEGAIQIIDGKAKLIAEKYCDGLGACLGDCPTGALKLIEREAEEFDEEAVEKYLEELEEEEKSDKSAVPFSCPSAKVTALSPTRTEAGSQSGSASAPRSALTDWPVQIKLIPPGAPFLNNADLLVLADCTAVVYPGLHTDLLPGKVVMMGCPKFDDPEEYIEKFSEIFKRADIRSITIANMEVPCCSGLVKIIEKALESSHRDIPVKQICFTIRGTVLEDENFALKTAS